MMDSAGVTLLGALTLYAAATVASVRYFSSWNLALDLQAGRFLWVGIVFHVLALFLRYQLTGYPPLTGFAEVLAVLGLCLAISLVLARFRVSIPALSTLFLPLVLLFTLGALLAGPPPDPNLQPQFRTPLMAIHVLFNLLGYSYFTLGFFTGVAFWIQEGRLKEHRVQAWTFHLPSLETMDRMAVAFTLWGFAFWTLGLALGVVGAIETKTEIPHTDPKVVSAWSVWALYALYFAVRWGFKVRGKRALTLAVAGYILALFTFFGVRFFLTTQHTFGQVP